MGLIVAEEITLTALGASPYTVHAYSIRISGQLKLPGGTVQLIARNITFDPGSSIDVTGTAGGAGDHGRPVNQPGQNGDDGKHGESGGDGGSVTLLAARLVGTVDLVAQGGDGGTGGDGGSGMQGAQGPPGQWAQRCDQYSGDTSHPAGNGSKGGDGGRGGRGGSGGKGGSISARVADATQGLLTPDLLNDYGGFGGYPGSTGAAGSGGAPGSPSGSRWVYDPILTTANRGIPACRVQFFADAGIGPAGGTPQPEVRGDRGQSGTADGQVIPLLDVYKEVRNAADPSYWQKLREIAEEHYYEAEYQKAAEYLQWIYNTTQV
jgi:hypothetical protein